MLEENRGHNIFCLLHTYKSDKERIHIYELVCYLLVERLSAVVINIAISHWNISLFTKQMLFNVWKISQQESPMYSCLRPLIKN